MPSGYMTLRHRRLTQLFRQLRHEAGLTGEEVARQLEWKASKIRRYETGEWKRIQPRDVRGLLEVYGITDKNEQDPYVQLAKDAGKRGWWSPYADIVGAYVAFEDESSEIKTFEPTFIPGLLQTEDYAQSLIRSDDTVFNPEAAQRRLEVQLQRRKLLHSEGAPTFWAIVDEPAIMRPVGGPRVMADQLKHLLSEASPQHITLQVLPMDVGAHPGMTGAFVILNFANPIDPPVLYLETATDGLYPEEPDTLERYRLMFDHLRVSALSQDRSAALVERQIRELEKRSNQEE